MRLNNKGYMLVEIIVAAVIAMSVAYYLINLTYKFKDQNMDIYNSTYVLSDKINITKNIMNDIDNKTISNYKCDSSQVTFSVGGRTRKLIISSNKDKLTYGYYNKGVFVTSDNSYYVKQLDNGNEFTSIDCREKSFRIGITNIYEDKEYEINIFLG